MTDIYESYKSLRRALDADPENYDLVLVFADLLEEMGREEALGLRELVRLECLPITDCYGTYWWSLDPCNSDRLCQQYLVPINKFSSNAAEDWKKLNGIDYARASRTWLEGAKIAIPRCCGCNNERGQGVRRRQNTLYIDEELNYVVACDLCFEDIQEYWTDMWNDYYGSRL